MKKERRNIIVSLCGVLIVFGLYGLYLWYRGELNKKEEPIITQDELLPSEDDMVGELLKKNFTAVQRNQLEKWLHKRRLFPDLHSPLEENAYDENARKKAKELCKKATDNFVVRNPHLAYPGWNCPTCGQRGWLLVNGKTIYVYNCSNGHLWER